MHLTAGCRLCRKGIRKRTDEKIPIFFGAIACTYMGGLRCIMEKNYGAAETKEYVAKPALYLFSETDRRIK